MGDLERRSDMPSLLTERLCVVCLEESLLVWPLLGALLYYRSLIGNRSDCSILMDLLRDCKDELPAVLDLLGDRRTGVLALFSDLHAGVLALLEDRRGVPPLLDER